jgi:hypothetical protein
MTGRAGAFLAVKSTPIDKGAFELPSPFVVNASTPVTSAAAKPSLTVASLSMRTAAHGLEADLCAQRSQPQSTNNQRPLAFAIPRSDIE